MENTIMRKLRSGILVCLALMGFPKNFKIADIPIKSAYKQIGNSVCVSLLNMLAKQI